MESQYDILQPSHTSAQRRSSRATVTRETTAQANCLTVHEYHLDALPVK